MENGVYFFVKENLNVLSCVNLFIRSNGLYRIDYNRKSHIILLKMTE